MQINLSGKVSSQYLTAILMAAPLAEGEGATEIISEGLISQPYVEMTIELMMAFCAKVRASHQSLCFHFFFLGALLIMMTVMAREAPQAPLILRNVF